MAWKWSSLSMPCYPQRSRCQIHHLSSLWHLLHYTSSWSSCTSTRLVSSHYWPPLSRELCQQLHHSQACLHCQAWRQWILWRDAVWPCGGPWWHWAWHGAMASKVRMTSAVIKSNNTEEYLATQKLRNTLIQHTNTPMEAGFHCGGPPAWIPAGRALSSISIPQIRAPPMCGKVWSEFCEQSWLDCNWPPQDRGLGSDENVKCEINE